MNVKDRAEIIRKMDRGTKENMVRSGKKMAVKEMEANKEQDKGTSVSFLLLILFHVKEIQQIINKIMALSSEHINENTAKELTTLRVTLGSKPLPWVEAFCNANGHVGIISLLSQCTQQMERYITGMNDPSTYLNLLQAIPEATKCLRALINNSVSPFCISTIFRLDEQH